MPLMLDLFCGAGGASRGYVDAGFNVVGIDINPQPHYPYQFIQGDALDTSLWPLLRYIDAIHASPPCQGYSKMNRVHKREHPMLIGKIRHPMVKTGKPYVIENVVGAPLIDPITLCGSSFDLKVLRHRLFETNWPLTPPAEHPTHPLVFTYDKRKAHYGKLDQDTSFVQVTGGGNATVANKRRAMGIPWAQYALGLNEAIPPAYTRYVGNQLMEVVQQ